MTGGLAIARSLYLSHGRLSLTQAARSSGSLYLPCTPLSLSLAYGLALARAALFPSLERRSLSSGSLSSGSLSSGSLSSGSLSLSLSLAALRLSVSLSRAASISSGALSRAALSLSSGALSQAHLSLERLSRERLSMSTAQRPSQCSALAPAQRPYRQRGALAQSQLASRLLSTLFLGLQALRINVTHTFFTRKKVAAYMTQPPVAVACFCSMPRAPAAKILAARNTALYWKWYFQVTSSRFERRVQDKMRRDLKRIIPHSIRPYGHSLPSYAAGNTSRRLVACLYWRISLFLWCRVKLGCGSC